MRAKKRNQSQEELFNSRLDQMLDPRHPLFRLSNAIDREYFEEEFGKYYTEKKGRPGKPIRLLVGLHYLKNAYDESDESCVERFLENPYWQYFCGFEHFQHKFPLEPTTLVRWRKRIGEEGIEKLFYQTLVTAQKLELLRKSHLNKVNIDTTVQEKAIAFPTDGRLYHKMQKKLVKAAAEHGIELRQSYRRLGKKVLVMQGRYAHAKQMKRARKETKKLKIYLGRITRELRRKTGESVSPALNELLCLSERLLRQQQKDKNKLYSCHAPEVECISKGKAHKRYEFGCKVSVAATSRDNWVVGIKAHHGNPSDGHTLADVLSHVERMTGSSVKEAYCDRGYRGHNHTGDTVVHIAGTKRRVSRSLRKWLRRRCAIEPIIGHLKSDGRLNRNYLNGKVGDKINALLCGSGANIRKLIAAFFLSFRFFKKLTGIMKHSKLFCSMPIQKLLLTAA
ncbi:IS5 family transposase [Candidatus Latescibacterota bacterium]